MIEIVSGEPAPRGSGKRCSIGTRLAGRDLVWREHPFGARADGDRPVVARRVGQREVGMESDGDRHRLGAEVVQLERRSPARRPAADASSRSCGRTETAPSTPAAGRTRAGSSPTPTRRRPCASTTSHWSPCQGSRGWDGRLARCPVPCRRRICCRWRRTPAHRAGSPTAPGTECPAWPGCCAP